MGNVKEPSSVWKEANRIAPSFGYGKVLHFLSFVRCRYPDWEQLNEPQKIARLTELRSHVR